METDNLQPGPELNELIAERVLDWHYDSDWDCLIPPEQVTKPPDMWTDWQRKKDENGEYYVCREPVGSAHVSGVRYSGNSTKIMLPDFSRDIAAAWLVIERMQSLDFIVNLWSPGKHSQADIPPCYWRCKFWKYVDSRTGDPYIFHRTPYEFGVEIGDRASDKSAPLAICLAALRSLEVKKEEVRE